MAYWLELRPNMYSDTKSETGIGYYIAGHMVSQAALEAEHERPLTILREQVPRVQALRRNPGKKPPTFVGGTSGYGQFGVCQRVKDAIETVEPGVHQFIEFELTKPGGKPIDEKYYHLNIMHCFDALIVEKSTAQFEWIDGRSYNNYRKKLVFRYKEPYELVMSQPKIAGRHLWTGALMMSRKIFCSEDMFHAFKKADLTRSFICRPIEEVDEPWNHEENVGPFLRWQIDYRKFLHQLNERGASK